MTPVDSAGVAINVSPIELVAMVWNVRPAPTTMISPSSLEMTIMLSAATGEALNPRPRCGTRVR